MDALMDISDGVNLTFRKRSRIGWLPGDQAAEIQDAPCPTCNNADTCKTMCKKLQAVLHSSSGCYEQFGKDFIIVLPEGGVINNFTSLPEGRDVDGRGMDGREHAVEFATGSCDLNVTKVFIEYFFQRRTLADIADDLGIGEGTVHSYFVRAVDRINHILNILDTRKHALKMIGMKKQSNLNRYTDDQKAFLLTHIFGFTVEEVAEILGGPKPSHWKRRIGRLSKKFTAAFESVK